MCVSVWTYASCRYPVTTLEPLLRHYDACLAEHGATAAGVDYGSQGGADLHYRVALELVDRSGWDGSLLDCGRLLDFGCGWGSLYDYMLRTPGWHDPAGAILDYTGLDILPGSIAAARERFPGVPFICSDILRDGVPDVFDYTVACGVFPRATGVDKTDLWDFMRDAVSRLFAAARIGCCWNVLSSHVDYETDDWFHVPFDRMADFVSTLTRTFVFRADYAWPGYTVYAYRQP